MSFFTSLSGLRNAQSDLGTISNNLANVETNGFKRSRADFLDIVAGSALVNPKLVQGAGSALQAITQIHSQGSIEQTGSALDLAINGEGFFAVQGASGEISYTRNGAFQPDAAGFVINNQDNRLLVAPVDATGALSGPPGTTVPMQLPTANAAGSEFAGVTIAADGLVVVTYADSTNEPIGRVALATFVAPNGLKQLGAAHWEATGLSGPPEWGVPDEGGYGNLLSGSIERSNVDITEELVGLLTAQRNFQANARAIDTAQQLTQTIIQIN